MQTRKSVRPPNGLWREPQRSEVLRQKHLDHSCSTGTAEQPVPGLFRQEKGDVSSLTTAAEANARRSNRVPWSGSSCALAQSPGQQTYLPVLKLCSLCRS
jgi:hypothetical protein